MLLATKALYAAGVVGGDDAAEIIRYGAKSRKPLLRVVSAAAAESLSPEMAESVLKPLLKSRDAGIKKWAKHTTKSQNALRSRSAKAPRAAP
ncbi:MAG: hypothetical protein C0483_10295 [Pirellula sp.]|nr:hypothetical protein [Pirellula sp.]